MLSPSAGLNPDAFVIVNDYWIPKSMINSKASTPARIILLDGREFKVSPL